MEKRPQCGRFSICEVFPTEKGACAVLNYYGSLPITKACADCVKKNKCVGIPLDLSDSPLVLLNACTKYSGGNSILKAVFLFR